MRTTRSSFPVLLITVVASACATAGAATDRTSRDLLTRAEVEESQQLTAYDAVRQERPRWLRVRGPNSFTSMNPIVVYVDGMRHGGVETLQTLPTMVVELIRYYGASEAQSRFGLGHTNGAIEVTTRTQ